MCAAEIKIEGLVNPVILEEGETLHNVVVLKPNGEERVVTILGTEDGCKLFNYYDIGTVREKERILKPNDIFIGQHLGKSVLIIPISASEAKKKKRLYR